MRLGRLDRIERVDTASYVSLRVVVGYPGNDGISCPTALSSRTASVELSTPLGDRALLGCHPSGSFASTGEYDTPEPRDPPNCS